MEAYGYGQPSIDGVCGKRDDLHRSGRDDGPTQSTGQGGHFYLPAGWHQDRDDHRRPPADRPSHRRRVGDGRRGCNRWPAAGENGPETREECLKGLEFLGVEIDREANNVRGKVREISKPGCKVKAFVIPTNEELMIARDTLELIQK